jgi:hypothetical protein
MLSLEVGQETPGGLLDQVEDALEAAAAAIVGVRHAADARCSREVHQQAQLRSLRRLCWAVAQDTFEVLLVHGDDVVEPLEVLGLEQSGTLFAEIDTAPTWYP